MNVLRLLILNEVSYKEALSLRLDEPIVALCRACSGPTACANRARLYTGYPIAARALKLGQIELGAIAQIKYFVEVVARHLHVIKYVEAPVNRMVVVGMFVGTDVAHARLAGRAELESLYVGKFRLVVALAGRDLAGRRAYRWDYLLTDSSGCRPLKYKL